MAKKENPMKQAKKNGAPGPAKEARAGKPKAEAAPKKPGLTAKAAPAAKPAGAAPKAAKTPAAAKAAPARPTPAKPAAKTAARPAPAAKATPQKATPQKATPQKATPQKATPQKAAPVKTAAPKAAPRKTQPAKAAPAKAPATRPAARQEPEQKAPLSNKATRGQTPSLAETEARKLAIQKIQAKRNQERPAPKQEPELTQPTGMYNGIVVTHEIKPFPAKTPYTKVEIDKLREALLDERTRLLGQLASLQGVSMEAMVSAKEHSGYSIHIAEHASDLQTAEANLGVRSIEEERLEQVESALDRIENNQRHYGLCMACGNKIGIQRLIAVPHAHLCMPCRKRYEIIRSRRGY